MFSTNSYFFCSVLFLSTEKRYISSLVKDGFDATNDLGCIIALYGTAFLLKHSLFLFVINSFCGKQRIDQNVYNGTICI